MYSRLLVLCSLLLLQTVALAQNIRVGGTVRNDKNEPLAGVSIKATTTGTTSATDGSFILTLSKGTKHTITFTAVGYSAGTITDYDPASGTDLNMVLQTSSQALAGVTVSGSRAPRRETVNALIAYQKNTSTVAQVISAETIRRSPDKNTGEVLRRVPGTSILEGKYLVVRGLADRYNQTMLNGVLLSSTEPDRKTFSYDIFPATMLDNMIINKAFVPELPGEWAGGLVQINTRDIPANGFLNVQVGTGFNTGTIGRDFYSYKGGRLDFLGIDDGFRAIPAALPTKGALAGSSPEQLASFGRQFANIWTAEQVALLPNHSAQVAGGFNTRLFGKRLGGTIALTYNRSFRRVPFSNRFIANEAGDVNFTYESERYSQDVLAGAMANFTLQLSSRHKISVRNLLNVNSSKYVTERTGQDFLLGSGEGQNLRATELALRQNVFFNTQLQGDHAFGSANGLKLRWYGGFNILDQYIPDQRRLQYIEETPGGAWVALIGGGNSQKSGSRFFSMLSDYNYTAGGDISKTFDLFGQKQTVKAGYMLQIKDRLFDSRPFYYGVDRDPSGQAIRRTADQIFAPQYITNQDGGIVFGELQSPNYRYMANTILNAGFIQFDNAFSDKLRAVWGVRYENFDQLVGSPRRSDPRHVHSVVGDWLPGVNLTYKLDGRTNIRLSGSQTVIRPEFRELSNFAFYDFELGATVLGNPKLQRTKVTNADLRYELYPRAGELFTVGVFYKYFSNPIETYFNNLGAGSSATFNFANMSKANSYGAEIELRKKLDFARGLSNFTLTSNLSYIYNRVEGVNVDRPMQGQSPYLVNVGLQYDHERTGFSSTLLFNRIGRRILYVGNLNQSVGASGIPDIWENPRSLLDLQVSKKVLKGKGEIRLNLSDVLNQPAIFYHDLDKNKKFNTGADVQAIRRSYGTNVSVTFNYAIR
ncbi:outer membrane beta-barrel protein [Flaviaesturariibacter amylovorans]|uniref:TonB-dependent receptor n=1 Tax=Flaviaesturariibacter amylovorans TaxID=1084520 RepID=A0ABP8G561_9BACT